MKKKLKFSKIPYENPIFFRGKLYAIREIRKIPYENPTFS